MSTQILCFFCTYVHVRVCSGCTCAGSCVSGKTSLMVISQKAGFLSSLYLAKRAQKVLGMCLASAGITSACHCGLLCFHGFLVVVART